MKTNTPLADALMLSIVSIPMRVRNDIASAFSKWCEMVIRN